MSLKLDQARKSLPDNLKPVFDMLIADYRFAALERHGAPYVSYVVLADLVKLGWRPPEDVSQKNTK